MLQALRQIGTTPPGSQRGRGAERSARSCGPACQGRGRDRGATGEGTRVSGGPGPGEEVTALRASNARLLAEIEEAPTLPEGAPPPPPPLEEVDETEVVESDPYGACARKALTQVSVDSSDGEDEAKAKRKVRCYLYYQLVSDRHPWQREREEETQEAWKAVKAHEEAQMAKVVEQAGASASSSSALPYLTAPEERSSDACVCVSGEARMMMVASPAAASSKSSDRNDRSSSPSPRKP